MSHKAVTWAYKQRAGSASNKAVLVAMANCADEDGVCFPSKALLSEQTELSKITIQKALKELREAGLIVDTGDRRGRTLQTVVYRLNLHKGSEGNPLKGSDETLKGLTGDPFENGKGSNEVGKGVKLGDPSIDEPSGNRKDDDEEARAISEKFVELWERHWPSRAPYLTPRMTLETEARQFLDAGGTVKLAVQHLEAQMPRVAARGRSPPRSLKFFRDSLNDELAKQRETVTFQSKPNGAETPEQRRQRIIEMARNGD